MILFIFIQVYLMPFLNEQGNTVIRIADDWDVSAQQLQHNYSTDQCFNADETLIKLAGYPSAILDANTYEFVRWSNIPSYARWSNGYPLLMYGTSVTKFVSHNALTDERVTLHDFGFPIDFGYGESNQDMNDRYVGLIGNGNTLIVYDIQNDIVLGTRSFSGDLDWFSVSKQGNYAVANYRPDGNGQSQGLKVYPLDLSAETHIYNYTEHSTLAIVNGQEVVVQIGNESTWENGYYLTMINLETGQETQLLDSPLWCGHISYSTENWVTISESCVDYEIFHYNLVTGEKISLANANGSSRASVSRSMDKVVYSDNYAYVVEQNTLSIDDVEFYQNVKTFYYDIYGRKLKSLEGVSSGVYIIEYRYKNRVERKKVIL